MSNDLSGLLYLAAKRQDPKMVEYLLSSYEGIVDVNMQDKVINCLPHFLPIS